MKPENKERFNRLLSHIKNIERRRQFNNFLNYAYLHSSYFTAPASPKYHCNWEEGLLEHSMNVAENALKINKALGAGIPEDSLVICALVHDFGKCYIEENAPYYLIKEATDKQKQWGYIPYPPYEYNKSGQVFMTVPQRAVRVLTQFVDITDEEYCAILTHDGQYVEENHPYGAKESPMQLILHYADSWAGFQMEGTQVQSKDGKSYVLEPVDKVGKYGREIRVNHCKEDIFEDVEIDFFEGVDNE